MTRPLQATVWSVFMPRWEKEAPLCWIDKSITAPKITGGIWNKRQELNSKAAGGGNRRVLATQMRLFLSLDTFMVLLNADHFHPFSSFTLLLLNHQFLRGKTVPRQKVPWLCHNSRISCEEQEIVWKTNSKMRFYKESSQGWSPLLHLTQCIQKWGIKVKLFHARTFQMPLFTKEYHIWKYTCTFYPRGCLDDRKFNWIAFTKILNVHNNPLHKSD